MQRSQIWAVMFRGNAIGLRFTPDDGLEVEGEGEITVYEPRGDLQLLVRNLAPAGIGALMRAFEELKRRLATEGLFEPSRKRPLPSYPRVVTFGGGYPIIEDGARIGAIGVSGGHYSDDMEVARAGLAAIGAPVS